MRTYLSCLPVLILGSVIVVHSYPFRHGGSSTQYQPSGNAVFTSMGKFGSKHDLQLRKRAGTSQGALKIEDAPPKLIEARQHGKTVLECSASGTPAPRITWYKDGKPLIKEYPHKSFTEGDYGEFALESLGETKSRINIDCVSESDAGLYECVAHTNDKKTSVGTEVHVVSFEPNGCVPRHLMNFNNSPPQIFQWMNTFLQTMGMDARLICRAEGHHETTWYGPMDEKVELESGKFKVMENGDLIIHDLSFSEMGMFKCIVRNQNGEDMKETFVYPHLTSLWDLSLYILILEQYALFPHKLDDGDDTRGNHPGQKHDEHATQIGQAKLSTVFAGSSLDEEQKMFFHDLALHLGLGECHIDAHIWGPDPDLEHVISALLQEVQLEVGPISIRIKEDLARQSHVLDLERDWTIDSGFPEAKR
eukprot:maker-scaffold59_size442576-snap-gene-3.31 protein:Tk11680 transcript:maker-scaffold59_size442576-snap-gene-3.31-mRNA-1 annotation:"neural ectodermal development factor imp-l2"